jgi:hypothetical protein
VELVRSGGIVIFPRAPTLEGYRTFLEQPWQAVVPQHGIRLRAGTG